MAKTIENASLTFRQGQPTMEVVATVRMPVAEYAAFLALAGLTDAVPENVTDFIAARLAAGSNSGG
jgi:hypothetical protein